MLKVSLDFLKFFPYCSRLVSDFCFSISSDWLRDFPPLTNQIHLALFFFSSGHHTASFFYDHKGKRIQ